MMTSSSKGAGSQAGTVGPLELALERNVQAPAIARAAITGLCDDLRLDGQIRQTLLLLVSEVVSNAVLHSTGPADAGITVTATVTADAVQVAVTDPGEGFAPAERDPARMEGGYGLYLLEKAARRWGVDAASPTRVWFELPIRA